MIMKDNNNIYIFKSYGLDNKSIYKLGYSCNIHKRLKEYLSLNPFIEIVASLNVLYPEK